MYLVPKSAFAFYFYNSFPSSCHYVVGDDAKVEPGTAWSTHGYVAAYNVLQHEAYRLTAEGSHTAGNSCVSKGVM